MFLNFLPLDMRTGFYRPRAVARSLQGHQAAAAAAVEEAAGARSGCAAAAPGKTLSDPPVQPRAHPGQATPTSTRPAGSSAPGTLPYSGASAAGLAGSAAGGGRQGGTSPRDAAAGGGGAPEAAGTLEAREAAEGQGAGSRPGEEGQEEGGGYRVNGEGGTSGLGGEYANPNPSPGPASAMSATEWFDPATPPQSPTSHDGCAVNAPTPIWVLVSGRAFLLQSGVEVCQISVMIDTHLYMSMYTYIYRSNILMYMNRYVEVECLYLHGYTEIHVCTYRSVYIST